MDIGELIQVFFVSIFGDFIGGIIWYATFWLPFAALFYAIFWVYEAITGRDLAKEPPPPGSYQHACEMRRKGYSASNNGTDGSENPADQTKYFHYP